VTRLVLLAGNHEPGETRCSPTLHSQNRPDPPRESEEMQPYSFHAAISISLRRRWLTRACDSVFRFVAPRRVRGRCGAARTWSAAIEGSDPGDVLVVDKTLAETEKMRV